jgi:hypothetical protein
VHFASLLLVLVLSVFSSTTHVYAQYGNPNPAVTPEQYEECKTLGIKPEKCSEQEILQRHCLGGPNIPCGGSAKPPELDPMVLSIMVGSGLAFAAGILTVRRFRNLKRFS